MGDQWPACMEPRPIPCGFDFDHDESTRNLFGGQAKKDSPTPFTVQIGHRGRRCRRQGVEEMKKHCRTNMCIVLVGRYMSSATGVAAEIAMA